MKKSNELEGNENDAINEQANETDAIELKSSVELAAEQESNRAEEAKRLLDAEIDRNIALYEAIAAKVSSEHERAAIYAALVNKK